MKPCMGGWCSQRDVCAHYKTTEACVPAERLCLHGEDGWQATENSQGGMVRRFVLPVAIAARALPSAVGAPG